MKDEFVKQLLVTRERHPFLLHAWVLMPNHVHMLVRFPATGTPSRCSEP
ncbi:MAG: transposase [Phycisphaerales bacterium]|nr:transposase [Phycisphaerales bacterium]